MCGRFALDSSIEELARALEAASVAASVKPRYNIAPTKDVVVARKGEDERELRMLRWGLVPAWAKDTDIGARLINARAETVAEKPSFGEAFRRRRCLIPSTGFYEWKREGTHKQPYYFRMKDERPFAFAGLWERWEGVGGKGVESCTILTTTASEILAPVHERMPVILKPEDYDLWLDTKTTAADKLTPLLRPYSAVEMTSHPVGSGVNNPRSDSADLIAPFPNSQ